MKPVLAQEPWQRERDACGVGLAADVQGVASRRIMEVGDEMLHKVSHRGAIAADGKTGDGAGCHPQIPQGFFRRILHDQFGVTPPPGNLAIGQFFMPHDAGEQERMRQITEGVLDKLLGAKVLAWRDVPNDEDQLGETAKQTKPFFQQAIIGPPTKDFSEKETEALLYIARREITRQAEQAGIDFYTCSLSARSIIYKALTLAENLFKFYPDLMADDFITNHILIHQRYSTNTVPTWARAHPYSMLAHNGEINTLRGNEDATRSVEKAWVTQGMNGAARGILPLIQPQGSDSAKLNDVFEYLVRMLDLSPVDAQRLLIPAAEGDHAFFQPWDGPANITFTDGMAQAGVGLDRNGLRPARYARVRTENGSEIFVIGSETGMVSFDPKNVKVIERGQLGPGQVIAVDFKSQRVIKPEEIAKNAPPATKIIRLEFKRNGQDVTDRHWDRSDLLIRQISAGMTTEEIDLLLRPLAETGQEAVSSMGNDAQVQSLQRFWELPILGDSYNPLWRYLKHAFAQITNPPIDSIREQGVMNLDVYLKRPFITEHNNADKTALTLASPILLDGALEQLKGKLGSAVIHEIDATFTIQDGDDVNALEKALARITQEAQTAFDAGRRHFILTDEHVKEGKYGIPLTAAVAGLHNHFKSVRSEIGLHVRAADVFEPHGVCMLLSSGASTVNPYLALQTIADEVRRGVYRVGLEKACANFQKGLEKGILKIMSKMGIAVLASYVGGFNFEVEGLHRDLVARYFPGVASRLSGLGFEKIQYQIMKIREDAERAVLGKAELDLLLPSGGRLHARAGSNIEHGADSSLKALLTSVRARLYPMYREAYVAHHARRTERQPRDFRDLLGLKHVKTGAILTKDPILLKRADIPDTVQPAKEIVKTFGTGAMSLGSISPEAHRTLTLAMNEIGGKSNTGEGSEENYSYDPADPRTGPSKIRQIASGRFGVTAEYLTARGVEEMQIKFAQGAKPGEGGAIRGDKVTPLIANLRHSTPGVSLISPPPHHDIYSIEDMAQLVYDLKQINPRIFVDSKLVAQSGVDTIGVGAIKGGCDVITLSGDSGGTGNSPAASIMHAGSKWEVHLADLHCALIENKLRHRTRIRVDGGFKRGMDVVKAALLGANEFGFGTFALELEGCTLFRDCHLNTCEWGIATQDPELRKKFEGAPEHVINGMMFVAEEVREILHAMGASSLEEITGRAAEFMEQVSDAGNGIDFGPVFDRFRALPNDGRAHNFIPGTKRFEVPDTLDQRVLREMGGGDLEKGVDKLIEEVQAGRRVVIKETAHNTDRTIGARTSFHLMDRLGAKGVKNLPDGAVTYRLKGSAGQSAGAFMVKGVALEIEGDANDYVGKGLSGGRIVVVPHAEECDGRKDQSIIGNTVLYGATSGEAYLRGMAGERFAVRNSGADVVVEGCGNNGLEYMTGGTAVVLGKTGKNFAAGMSGGEAYVYDPYGSLKNNLNSDTVATFSVENPLHEEKLKSMLEKHHARTKSEVAGFILKNWQTEKNAFRVVMGKEMLEVLPSWRHPATKSLITARRMISEALELTRSSARSAIGTVRSYAM